VEALLSAHGLPVRCFTSAEEFLAKARPDGPGCLVTDLRLPGISGLELVLRLQGAASPLTAILVTGTTDVTLNDQNLQAGLVILEKPYTAVDFVRIVRQSLAASQERWQRRQAAAPRH
jgi:FixJ family two-component response regulator